MPFYYGENREFTTPGDIPAVTPLSPGMSRCAGPYNLLIYGVSGLYTASESCFISLVLRRRVNGPDTAVMTFDGRDNVIDFFTLDTQVEIWRSNPLLGISHYKEAELLHRTGEFQWDERAQAYFVSKQVGYEDLLNRRILLGGDDEAIYAQGLYPAETVMKEIVRTQCGLGGTRAIAPGYPITGLSIETTHGRGDIWAGYRKGERVLAYLQDIAEGRNMAFKVIGTTPGLFIYQAYPNPYGADRTARGVDRTTGRNYVGNMPIIFSEQRHNVRTLGYSVMREGEGNVAIDTDSDVITDGPGQTDSPWNRCEFPIIVSPRESVADVAATGLERMKAREEVPIKVIQTPECAYGRHYFLGDRVSVYVSAPGIERVITAIITGVVLSVQRRGGELDEQIDLELSTAATETIKDPFAESLTNLNRRLKKLELW